MNNYKATGDVLTFTSPSAGMDPETEPGGVVSGMAYLVGTLLVVATATVGPDLPFEGKRCGVFELPKATGQTWDEGEALYWDDTEHVLTTTAEDNTPVGCATAAAGSGDTTGCALLTGVPAEPINLET